MSEEDWDAPFRAAERLGERLSGLVRPAADAAATMERAFSRSFDALERTLTRAARTGELSFKAMVDAIVADLARLAIQTFVTKPIEGILSNVAGSLFGGARALGGPVGTGRAFLVGERGPETFVPSVHGRIEPRAGGGRPTVVVNVTARDAGSFVRSQGQIAAALARAVARGARAS